VVHSLLDRYQSTGVCLTSGNIPAGGAVYGSGSPAGAWWARGQNGAPRRAGPMSSTRLVLGPPGERGPATRLGADQPSRLGSPDRRGPGDRKRLIAPTTLT